MLVDLLLGKQIRVLHFAILPVSRRRYTCIVGAPSDFGGFTNVVRLHLECIAISGRSLESIISNSR